MKRTILRRLWLVCVTAGVMMAQDYRPKLFLSLPDYCNTPDGMTIDGGGNIILSCPNFSDTSYPGILMKIDSNAKASIFFTAPVHPDTKRGAPMGIELGPDGNLYYADNQYFNDKNYKSRLIRVVVENGAAVRGEVVADGFRLANAVRWQGNYIYVNDTWLDLPDEVGASGVYRFTMDELKAGTVHLRPGAKDPHMIARFRTVPNRRIDAAGSDGLALDKGGNLFTGNFGDGAMSKVTFDGNGKVVSNQIVNKSLTCADGIVYDKKRDKVYIADSEKNAIQVLSMDGSVKTLWENEDTDGADGLLDQPCEPLVRGDDLIIANFDSPFPGLKNQQTDKYHTLSIIGLK